MTPNEPNETGREEIERTEDPEREEAPEGTEEPGRDHETTEG